MVWTEHSTTLMLRKLTVLSFFGLLIHVWALDVVKLLIRIIFIGACMVFVFLSTRTIRSGEIFDRHLWKILGIAKWFFMVSGLHVSPYEPASPRIPPFFLRTNPIFLLHNRNVGFSVVFSFFYFDFILYVNYRKQIGAIKSARKKKRNRMK